MANKGIKGITVEIGGNTEPIAKALEGVNAKARDLQNELKQVEKLLKLDPRNTELLAQKQKLLADSIAASKGKLDTLKEAERQAQAQFARGKISEEQYRALQREVAKTEQSLKGLETQAKKANGALTSDQAVKNLKGMAIGAGVALGAAGAVVVGGLKDAIEAEAKVAQLDAVLKSTGSAAGMTREELLSLAEGFEKTTKFSAEMALESESLLLTFTNIGKDTFPRATKAAADMATAMGTDMAGQSIALGKALNDPTKGIAALTRVGVTFTQAQKDQIKAMQESGDMAGAQTVILKELEKEFGGSAEAAGKTFGGQLLILKNAAGAIAESLATKFLPAIQALLDHLMGLPAWMEKNKTLLTIIGIALGSLTVAIIAYNVAAAWGAISTWALTTAGAAFGAVLAFITSPITLVILAIGALIAIGVLLAKNWDKIVARAKAIFGEFKNIGSNIVKGIWEGISGAATWIADKVSGFFGGLIGGVKKLLGIHSPSSVFEDAIGRNMALGIGVGFSDQMKSVRAGMERGLQVSVPTSVSMATAGAGAARAAAGTAMDVSGTIRVEGVNDQGQFVAAADYAVDQVMSRLRREARGK